ncbi:hypothetical protein LEP3755_12600 [Leptolyngbya sp. NIES-3755]|nr:hypothetical protein LEP3755_12600 [Leptolyngbya sp. NIES-3755]
MSELLERITLNPKQCGGNPCIRGMRIRVSDVLDLFAAGLSAEQILGEMPDLEVDDLKAAFLYAAQKVNSVSDTLLIEERDHKNALLAQLASAEAVIWSPQTDQEGIQALSDLLMTARTENNVCSGDYLDLKDELFAQESVDSLYPKISDFQSS